MFENQTMIEGSHMTALLRVREKNQVTLPRDVVRHFGIQSPDHLEYSIVKDGVLLRPLRAGQGPSKLERLRKLAQSVKSCYGSAAEVDAFIQAQRAQWPPAR
jgi:bifunctional DNA-binding transcriptional regulator/antitoxin component of YhaV-PrlF toxin-antitoxin module